MHVFIGADSSRFILGLAMLAVCAILTACTPPPDSDIPWNRPQPWEGSPMIPGMTP